MQVTRGLTLIGILLTTCNANAAMYVTPDESCRKAEDINNSFESVKQKITDATIDAAKKVGAGVVEISLVIKSSGTFENVKVLSSGLKDDAADTRIAKIVSKLKMKPVDCGDYTLKRYPIRFQAS